MQASNSKTMHRANLSVVLRSILDSGGISRRDIAAQTGLTPATVTNITAQLLAQGYILETGALEAGMGRKPITLQVNPARYGIVGIELSADSITCVLADFTGAVTAQTTVANRPDNTPDQAVAIAWQAAETLLARQSVARERILGVGLMSSGPYDRGTGTLIDPPNFTGEGWLNAPVRDLLAEKSGLPVLFERDSVGCALAEAGTAPGTLFAVMVNTVGIGGGLLVSGDIFYGRNSGAAEIGHMTVLMDGPRCGCGDRGCLEAVSSGQAIARALGEKTGRAWTAEEAVAAYRAGEPDAVETVQLAARCLGQAIGNVIKCVSPDMIAVGGRFITLFPEYYDLVRQQALSRRYIQIEGGTRILPFSHGGIQSAVGAVRLVLGDFYRSLGR